MTGRRRRGRWNLAEARRFASVSRHRCPEDEHPERGATSTDAAASLARQPHRAQSSTPPPETADDLLDVRLSIADRSALISLGGEIDLGTAPELLEAVDVCLACGARGITIDLSAVTFCDCAGLNAFDRARRRTAAAGGVLHLLAPSPPVARLFAILAPGEPPAR